MALSFPRTGGLFTDDFFSPFFGPLGFPDVTREFSRALAPSEGGQQQLALATRGMPVDVVSEAGGAIASASGRVGIRGECCGAGALRAAPAASGATLPHQAGCWPAHLWGVGVLCCVRYCMLFPMACPSLMCRSH